MNERIKHTIENLINEKPIKSEKVAVLVCPPLTQKRFEKEKKKPGFISQRLGRKKEFVRIVLESYNWKSYQDEKVLYGLKCLLEIEEKWSVTVIPDVKFRHFKKVLRSRYYDVIFLFAHHMITKEENNKNRETMPAGEIEFADGGIPLEKIRKLLSQMEIGNRMSLIFMICESSELQAMSYNLPAIGSVATAFWQIELIYGIEFVKTWIQFLNGKNTLSQAYNMAIAEFIKLNKN